MKSRDPFLQELSSTSIHGLEYKPCPPSLPPPYSQGMSHSMEKSIEHKFFSLLHLKEFPVCFKIPETLLAPQGNEMMRYLASHGSKCHPPHFTDGETSFRSKATDVDKLINPNPMLCLEESATSHINCLEV